MLAREIADTGSGLTGLAEILLEDANDPTLDFGARDILSRAAGKIVELHAHAYYAPAIIHLTADQFEHLPSLSTFYASEAENDVVFAKANVDRGIQYLENLAEIGDESRIFLPRSSRVAWEDLRAKTMTLSDLLGRVASILNGIR